MSISIVPTKASLRSGGGPLRSPKSRILAELQGKGKHADQRPSDEVETLKFAVHWEASKGALGVVIPPDQDAAVAGELEVVSLHELSKTMTFSKPPIVLGRPQF